MKFPKNASKQQESIIQLNVAHFEEKNCFCLYLFGFTALYKRVVYISSKFSSGFSPFLTC